MNLKISGHHVEVTPAIREYVMNKLTRVLRHFDQVIDAQVIMTVEGTRQKAEISVHVRGRDLYCDATDVDLYTAIDLMMDKLDRQVIKHKDKLQAHTHEPLKRKPLAEPSSLDS